MATGPSNVQATLTNGQITVTWTNPSSIQYNRIYIDRDTAGSSTRVWISANSTSYLDTSVTYDSVYTYTLYGASDGEIVTSGATSNSVTMLPAKVRGITLSRVSGSTGTIAVSLSNISRVATSIEYQTSANGSTWSTSTEISGNPVKSFTIAGLSGMCYVRVRNKNAIGTSAWKTSDAIAATGAPLPPTLIAPINIADTDDSSSKFIWQHNPIDSTEQSSAIIEYSTDNASWTTITVTGSSQEYTLPSFAEGTHVYWRAKTKGAYNAYSEYAYAEFTAYGEPVFSFVQPSSMTITTMPINVRVLYIDTAGFACTEAYVELRQNGITLYKEQMTQSTQFGQIHLGASITTSEYILENNQTYQLVVTARSESSLQGSITANITTSFTVPRKCKVTPLFDETTGYVGLNIGYDGTGGAAVTGVDVFRVTDHVQQLVKNVSVGTSITDRYAPLNTPVTYRVVSNSSTGAIYTNDIVVTFKSKVWYAYWGDNVAYAKWNPEEGGIELSRPEKVLSYYSGRKYPVSYDGAAVSETRATSFMLIDKDRANDFRKLMEDGGRGVYKSCDGQVCHADFTVRLTPALTKQEYYGSLELGITRIDGDSL